MSDDQILTYIFLGLVAFLFIMILVNVIGGPRKGRHARRRMHSRAHDGLGAKGHSWGARHDGGGGDSGDGGGDGGGD